MGSQNLKITRELDLSQTAQIKGQRILVKDLNYAVDRTLDSGSIMCASNNEQNVYFFIPPANTCGGRFFTFININTAPMFIYHPVGTATNCMTDGQIFCELSVNTSHLINCINFTEITNVGTGCTLVSDGTKYLLFNNQIGNTKNFTQPK